MSNIEFWFEIPDYEGLYQVSDLGRVKTLNYKRSGKEKILIPTIGKNGYKVVTLTKNGKQRKYYIHRLVAMAMIENPFPDKWVQVNHRDEDKMNNRVENLEWCSASYNTNYGTGPKRRLDNRHTDGITLSIQCGRSYKVLCVETGEVFMSTRDVERKLGYDYSNIASCCRGNQKTSYGYHWKYI